MKKQVQAFLFILMLIALLASPVYAVQVASEGTANSSGLYDISIDELHMITFNGGLYGKYELATTSDTLTIAESGKTVIVEGVGTTSFQTNITLPDADVGLEYTVLVGGGMTPMAGGTDVPDVVIAPQSTDIFYYVNDNDPNTFVAGDRIQSSGTTGDSISFICGKDLYWYVTGSRGTWSDYGQ